jgi:hypothetical protein
VHIGRSCGETDHSLSRLLGIEVAANVLADLAFELARLSSG